MELEALYQLVEDLDISVCEGSFPYSKCLAIVDDKGDCAIAIDPSQFDTRKEEKVALAHDLGHCITGSFYTRDTPHDLRVRYENRATKKAVFMLIPFDMLIDAIESPWNSIYDLAEHFGVSEDFMRNAVKIYEPALRKAYQNKI